MRAVLFSRVTGSGDVMRGGMGCRGVCEGVWIRSDENGRQRTGWGPRGHIFTTSLPPLIIGAVPNQRLTKWRTKKRKSSLQLIGEGERQFYNTIKNLQNLAVDF